MRLEVAKNLMEFFRERIARVRRQRNIQLMEMTEFYLVNLLSEAIETKKIFLTRGTQKMDEPLALICGRALASPSENERFALLKQVGDRSLYVSGFFGESLARRAIDIDYFISMGEVAYNFVSAMADERQPNRGLHEVFEELSKKFACLVDLISEISEATGITSDQDLLRLYERWLATKSQRLLTRLQEKGLIPGGMA